MKELVGLIYFLTGVFAAMTSWFLNGQVGWALFHWICGPFYLVYAIFLRAFNDGGFMEIINWYF